MQHNRYKPQTTRHKVGEVRCVNGQRSMCINPEAVYAGGRGALWITEKTHVNFTLVGSACTYRGLCKRVDPKNKSASVLLTDGLAWGKYKPGAILNIQASKFIKCDQVNSQNDDILNEIKIRIALIKADALKESLMIEEAVRELSVGDPTTIKRMANAEFHNEMKSLMKAYQKYHSLVALTEVMPEEQRNHQIKHVCMKMKKYIERLGRM